MNSFCTFWTLCETKHRLTNAARGCLAFFVPVCGLCASSADKTENLNLLHVVRDDQGMSIVLGYSRSKQYASVGLNWAIRCSYHSEHRANRLTATWPVVLRVTLKEAAGEAEKEGLLVVAVMLSVLCTAIVHESLLEAKSVRTEQGFPRDPSLSAGMPRGKFSPGGGKDRSTDTRYVHSALESGLLRKTGQAIEQPVWNHSTSSGVPTTLRDSFTTFLHNPMKTTVSFHLWTTWLYTNGLDEWHEWIFLFVCLFSNKNNQVRAAE